MVRAEGMGQSGKSLHCEHGDFISAPRTHLKTKPGTVSHGYNPNTGKVGNKETMDGQTVPGRFLSSSNFHTHAYPHRNVYTHVNTHIKQANSGTVSNHFHASQRHSTGHTRTLE